jgi:hypothetical protein
MANDDVTCLQILLRTERQRMLLIRPKVYLSYVDARMFSPSSLRTFPLTHWNIEKRSENTNEQILLLK